MAFIHPGAEAPVLIVHYDLQPYRVFVGEGAAKRSGDMLQELMLLQWKGLPGRVSTISEYGVFCNSEGTEMDLRS